MGSTPPSSSAGGAGCTGTVANSWGAGFQVDATFPHGPPSISAWKVDLGFGQSVMLDGWNSNLAAEPGLLMLHYLDHGLTGC